MNRESVAVPKVLIEFDKAVAKHPEFHPWEAGVCLITEEVGELAQAVNDGRLADAITEAAHVAVTAIRFIEEMMKEMEG